MASTFDIRFARTEGLAALFEAPGNRFRWKGTGRLSIDAQGISIAVKRGLGNLLLRRRSHRIAADQLTEVYREGAALRLEFGADDQREVLPIWASGTEAAAEIVKLLPTSRTVELEHATRASGRFRVDWRLTAWIVVTVVLVAAVSLWWRQSSMSLPVEQAAPVPVVVGTPLSPIDQILSREGVKPLLRGTVEHDIALRQQAQFESELATLRSQYMALLAKPTIEALDAMEPAWWGMTLRIDTSEEMSGPAFTGFREAQLAVIGSWRTTVALHAAGLRLKDDRLVELAAKQRALSEVYERLVRMYVP
jgi:hypothetical protein